MSTTTLVILGLAVPIRYDYIGPDSIQWFLDKDADEMTDPLIILAEALLRKHYTNKISLMLWEEVQAVRYEEDARLAAMAEDYNPF